MKPIPVINKLDEPPSRATVGIDLGTTRTAASYLKEHEKHSVLIDINLGAVAKRLLGKSYGDFINSGEEKYLAFKVVEEDHSLKVHVEDGTLVEDLPPEAISSTILRYVRKCASKQLNTEVKDAVVTVPAYFSTFQRQATIEAAHMAGFEEVKILNEPTSAAINHVRLYGNNVNKKKYFLVYDLGGGTFDVSLLNENEDEYTVLAVDGNSHLGGEDINNLLMELVAKKIDRNLSNMSSDDKASLRKSCEEAKEKLSSSQTVKVRLEADVFQGAPDIILPVIGSSSNSTDEDIRKYYGEIEKMLDTTVEITQKFFGRSSAHKFDKKECEVLLIGGSSRIPYIKNRLVACGFDINNQHNPDMAIANGAARFAYKHKTGADKKGELMVKDLLGRPVGILVDDGEGGSCPYTIAAGDLQLPITGKKKNFVPTEQGQDHADVVLVQGERDDYVKLAEYKIQLPSEGVVKVQTTINVDDNGLVMLEVYEGIRNTRKELKSSIQYLTPELLEQYRKTENEYVAWESDVQDLERKVDDIERLVQMAKQRLSDDRVYECEESVAEIRRTKHFSTSDELQKMIDDLKNLFLSRESVSPPNRELPTGRLRPVNDDDDVETTLPTASSSHGGLRNTTRGTLRPVNDDDVDAPMNS